MRGEFEPTRFGRQVGAFGDDGDVALDVAQVVVGRGQRVVPVRAGGRRQREDSGLVNAGLDGCLTRGFGRHNT